MRIKEVITEVAHGRQGDTRETEEDAQEQAAHNDHFRLLLVCCEVSNRIPSLPHLEPLRQLLLGL